jgi:hypothetical protein
MSTGTTINVADFDFSACFHQAHYDLDPDNLSYNLYGISAIALVIFGHLQGACSIILLCLLL